MNDTISRQAVIDAICSVCGYDCDKSEFIYNAPQDEQVILCPEHYVLTQLPSAQPIIRCKDCKQFRRWIDTDITFCDRTESEMQENDYCSYAERKEDASNR